LKGQTKLDNSNNSTAQLQKGLVAYSNNLFDEAYSVLFPIAEEGNSEAQYIIGNFFDEGLVVAEDPSLAIHWYEKSREQGNLNAKAALAYFYSNEDNDLTDKEKGENYARDIVELYSTNEYEFDCDALGWLGLFRSLGIGCNKDLDLAETFYKKSIKRGDCTSWLGLSALRMIQLGEECKNGEVSDPRLSTECLEFLQKSTDANVYMGWYLMADFYDSGTLGERSRIRSFDCYLNAAKLGFVDSMIKVAEKYEKGIGTSKNIHLALKWLLEAEKRGSPKAQYAIGTINSRCPEINISEDKLLDRVVSAAEKKYPPAMYLLSTIIKADPNLGPNDELVLLREAAELGDLRAKNAYGLRLCFGDTKSLNPELGFELIGSAVENGHVPAYFALALCYLNGRGVAQELYLAVENFETALSEGYYLAALALGEIYTDPDFEGFDNKAALAYLQLAQNRLTESHYIEKANHLIEALTEELSVSDCEKSNEWAAGHTRFHFQ
jgi:uncharacterized protein